MDLVDILHQTLSKDRDVSDSAQAMIDVYGSLNLKNHLTSLVSLLLDMENGENIRSAAAFQIVTTLKSGDPLETRFDYSYRWFSIGADSRQNIKTTLLKSLNFEAGRPSFVAACLTFIAEIEFCRDQWPDLLPTITENIIQTNNPDYLRQNSLEVIGLLAQKFEDENCEQLDSNGNKIFTAIFYAFKTGNSHCVKTSAVECLMHWMRFITIKSQYENDVISALCVLFEYIENPEFEKAALKSLTGILKKYNASLSYPFCLNIDRLFTAMLAAITNSDVDVRIEGFRFCQELCSAEGSVLKFLEFPLNSWNYTKIILPDLLEILMNVITYQDEICAQPASACLSTLAIWSDDSAIQNFIINFFKTNITSKDWRLRNASLVAFNSFNWGSGIKSMSLVQDLLPILLDILANDDHIEVKISAAVCFEKLSLAMIKVEVQELQVNLIINTVLLGLNMAPKIALHFCKALQYIATASFELMAVSSTGGFLLIEYFDPILNRLLDTMNRTDADELLRAAAYEALKGIVDNCPEHCYPAIGKMAPVIIQHHLQIEQKLENFAVASSLLSTLEVILQRMPDEEAYDLSYLIVPSLLQIFIKSVYNSNVRSITFDTIATLVKKLKQEFSKHLDVLRPFLISELKNPKRYQVCIAVIQLIQCICQNIADQVVCFSSEVLPILLRHLQNGCVSQRLKESILLVIGAITSAVGPQLNNHVELIMALKLVQSQMDKLYVMSNRFLNLNDIHDKFLNAYSGVLTGFRGDEVTLNYITELLTPHLNQMIQVAVGIIENKSEDEILEEVVMSKSIHFLYKFINCFERSVLSLVDTKTIKKLLVKGSHAETEETKKIAILTMERLILLKRQALLESCYPN